MPNPYKNKVVYNGTTLIDLTSDTVTPETLIQGYTAHDASGALVTGIAGAGGIVVTDEQESHGGTIKHISGVERITGTRNITVNGLVDVASVKYANVQVPVTYSSSDKHGTFAVYSSDVSNDVGFDVSKFNYVSVDESPICDGHLRLWLEIDANTTFTFKIDTTGKYCYVDWGDGSEPTNNASQTGSVTYSHTYEAGYFCAEAYLVNPPDSSISCAFNGISDTSLRPLAVGIEIPNGQNLHACNYLVSLRRATLCEGITSLPQSLFSSCTSLESVVIPESVTSMSTYTFQNCTSLHDVYMRPTTPPSTTYISTSFRNMPSDYIVHVPLGSLSVYQQDSQWSEIATHIQEGE